MTERATATDISRALAARASGLCVTLLPNGRKHGNEWTVGSVAGERGDSMKIHLAGRRAGVWADFATGERGDALSLVRAVLQMDMRGALEWSRAWLGMPPERIKELAQSVPAPECGKPDAETVARIDAARRIWRESVPIADSLGEKYLRSTRAIGLETWPATVRFHDRLKMPPGLFFPGIVLPVQRCDGSFAGIHRTFLDPRTIDKAVVGGDASNARRTLGDIRGGAVRLGPVASSVTLCEGLESGLSVLLVEPERTVWLALSTGLLCSIELPAAVRHVCLIEENDKPDRRGRRASPDACARARDRFLREGRTVEIVKTPAGYKDPNDVLRGRKIGAVVQRAA